MIDIRKEFSEEIKRIVTAARENREEAYASAKEAERVMDECQDIFDKTFDTASRAHQQFGSTSKIIKKLGRDAQPSVESVKQEIYLLQTYVDMTEKLPQAREELQNSISKWQKATDAVNEADLELQSISYLES